MNAKRFVRYRERERERERERKKEKPENEALKKQSRKAHQKWLKSAI